MRLCILVADEHIEKVREKATANFPNLNNHILISTPMSPTGDGEPTHWFCSFPVSEEMLSRMMSLKEFSEMEVGEPISFLRSRGLRFVKRIRIGD